MYCQTRGGQGIFGPERPAGHTKSASDELKTKPYGSALFSAGMGANSLDMDGVAEPNKVKVSGQVRLLEPSISQPKSLGVEASSVGLAAGLFHSTQWAQELASSLGSIYPFLGSQSARMNSKSLGPFRPHAAQIPNQHRPKPKES